MIVNRSIIETEARLTVDDYLSRQKVISKLLSTGEWQNLKVRRLIYAIFGNDEQHLNFLHKCSQDEIHEILIANGFDLEALNDRLHTAITKFEIS